MFGGWLAAVCGAWFIVGPPLSVLWDSPTIGTPTGSTNRQLWEYIGFFGGLGAVIVFLAAFALGRFAVVGVREAERAAQATAVDDRYETEPTTTSTGTTATGTIPGTTPGTTPTGTTQPGTTGETTQSTPMGTSTRSGETTEDTGGHHLPWRRSKHASTS
jgi:hypothetical protein